MTSNSISLQKGSVDDKEYDWVDFEKVCLMVDFAKSVTSKFLNLNSKLHNFNDGQL
jgi:hypothetical protein